LDTLGKILRKYRESKGLLLRQVAASLEIDTALLSKFERDERLPKKEQVIAFALFYKIDTNQLLVTWLSDKLTKDLIKENVAIEALKLAEQKVKLLKRKRK
jgi:HTH-type transcriptional regulator, competence development regulator